MRWRGLGSCCGPRDRKLLFCRIRATGRSHVDGLAKVVDIECGRPVGRMSITIGRTNLAERASRHELAFREFEHCLLRRFHFR